MVKMILNLMAMEQDIKQIHAHVDRIARDFQGFDDDAAVISLRNHLNMLQSRQQEAVNLWPQLGAPVR
jgi:DNA anti-recombination protein RmuC